MKKPVLGAVFLVVLLVMVFIFDIRILLESLLLWVESLGIWAPLVFGIIYIVGIILLFPGSVLTLGAGLLFGLFWGTVIVSLASTIGAGLAFLIGRYFARDWVEQKLPKKFESIDNAVGKEGWKIVFLTRLSPLFPFTLQNYAYGLTKIGFWKYFFASWIGMLPGTIMYVYFGTLAGSLVELDSGRSSMEWVFFMVGLIATVLVTLYVTNLARNALKRHVKG